ncbi:hypothetical protein BGY98DRAFT_1015674 [Russula aff. rugulosa BPL654]|nr:hypothetical protein BGY98DRAFT_1015674 [Russula aff. rugulosa BPL654]
MALPASFSRASAAAAAYLTLLPSGDRFCVLDSKKKPGCCTGCLSHCSGPNQLLVTQTCAATTSSRTTPSARAPNPHRWALSCM